MNSFAECKLQSHFIFVCHAGVNFPLAVNLHVLHTRGPKSTLL